MAAGGDVDAMMRHSADYLDIMSVLTIAWQWLAMAAAAQEGLERGAGAEDFYRGKLCTAQYWFHTELPRIAHLAHLCRTAEDSYARMQDAWF